MPQIFQTWVLSHLCLSITLVPPFDLTSTGISLRVLPLTHPPLTQVSQTQNKKRTNLGSPAMEAANPQTYLDELKQELKKKWPKNRSIRIVAHGHSVPTGYFKGGQVETFKSYPHLLHRQMAAAYPTAVISVVPTGVGGENATRGLQRFREDVLALKPDVIIIDYGLNDRAVGLEAARKAWTQMIQMAKSQGAKVVLLTPSGDLNADIFDEKDSLSLHAMQIRAMAAKHNVGLVDSYKLFRTYSKKHNGYKAIMSQSNHPNLMGHRMIADELANWFLSGAKD